MAASTIHLFSETDRLRIECAKDEPTLWIRGENEADRFTVSMKLDRNCRDKLRAALDVADRLETGA
jgi:hypothetical protein